MTHTVTLMVGRMRGHAQGALIAGIGIVVALVVLWPLLSGSVFLLDWSVGARSPLWPRAADGLDGGVTAGLPFTVVTAALAHLTSTAGWLVPAAVFPIGAIGIARLVGGSTIGRISAVLLYDINPIVFDRLSSGQVAFLLGYALLPHAARAALMQVTGSPREHVRRAVPVAIWWAVLTACSIHFAWIFGALVVGRALRGPGRATAAGLGAAVAGLALTGLYLVLPPAGQQQPGTVSHVDLVAYRSQGDPHVGLLGNLLGLYGFWHRGFMLPKQELHAWWLVLLPILAVVAIGLHAALRDPDRRAAARILLGCGAAGLVVSLGDQGPTGPVFRFVFDHVGVFQVMREPQKALALLALLYAVAFGWGADAIWHAGSTRTVVAALAPVVLLLPLAYTPTMAYGLNGQLRPGHVPASFAQANTVMGRGPESVLFLPWHQYESFPWSGQITNNPGQLLFDRPTIVGDDVELPQVQSTSSSTRSHYLEYLYAQSASVHAFGALVSPLGVKFVVVAKTLDWRSYDWLGAQTDLTVTLDTPDLVVYRSTAAVDVGHRVGELRAVDDWGSLVALANAGQDVTDVEVRNPAPGPISMPAVGPGSPRGQIVTRRSLTSFTVPQGAPGSVVVAEAHAAGWRGPGDARPIDLGTGAMAFPVNGGASSLVFDHRTQALAGEILSAIALLALLGITFLESLRKAGATFRPRASGPNGLRHRAA